MFLVGQHKGKRVVQCEEQDVVENYSGYVDKMNVTSKE